MKKIFLIVLIFVICGVFFSKSQSKLIPDNAIRLRVIPNSNSLIDQNIKLLVKEEIEGDLYNLLKDTKGIDSARKVIFENIPYLDNKINNLLTRENYTLGYTLDYGYHYFPEKEFKGITYDEGEYESLLITLGRGEGDNWWCVLFPPLCLIEAEESDEPEYKFFIKEIIDKYL